MNLIRVLNVLGITITLIGASKMYSEAMADREATNDDVSNIIKIINKQTRFNARIVIFGAVLQLLAALLDP
jgi:hypothetical protein